MPYAGHWRLHEGIHNKQLTKRRCCLSSNRQPSKTAFFEAILASFSLVLATYMIEVQTFSSADALQTALCTHESGINDRKQNETHRAV
jgi:hypothetical protein